MGLRNAFPWIDKHLAKGGIIGIETFYQEPEPAFVHPIPSLWTLNELTSFLMTETKLYAKELYARQYENIGFDMNGQTRKFFISSLIAQKIN